MNPTSEAHYSYQKFIRDWSLRLLSKTVVERNDEFISLFISSWCWSLTYMRFNFIFNLHSELLTLIWFGDHLQRIHSDYVLIFFFFYSIASCIIWTTLSWLGNLRESQRSLWLNFLGKSSEAAGFNTDCVKPI